MTLTCHPLWAVIITQPCIPPGLLNASDYVLDSYCLVGTVEAGLRKCRLGLSSCLPVVASSVGDERGSTARLRPASLRTRLRRTHQPPLAPGSGESRPTVHDVEPHRQTWVKWFVSPIWLVDVPSALLGPILCWYRPWYCLPSATWPSRSPDPPSGTACRTTWYLPRLCQPPVSV